MRPSLFASVLFPLLSFAGSASAGVITVTTTADAVSMDGACSLREAVDVARTNAGTTDCPVVGAAGDDQILLPEGTISLQGVAGEDANAGGDLDLGPFASSLTITGAGTAETVIDGGLDDRIFDLVHAGSVTLRFERMTLRHGRADDGGAIRVSTPAFATTVRIDRVRIEDSQSTGDKGGGVYVDASGLVTVTDSTFEDCTAANDAGGLFVGGASTEIDRVSFVGNTAVRYGGSVYVNSAPLRVANATFTGSSAMHGVLAINASTATVTHCTFAGNSGNGVAPSGAAGVVRLRNTIIVSAHNVCAPFSGGTVVSEGYNLLSSGTDCGGLLPSDVPSAAPMLSALGMYGGETPTMRPLRTSPARNAGTCTDTAGTVLATDQRLVARPAFGTCDIGAVEREPETLTVNDTEPAGTECAGGGIRTEVGVDDDDDGVLTEGEIDGTTYDCEPVMLRVVTPAGEGFCYGRPAFRVQEGIDDDEDGVLDPEEVDSDVYQCEGGDTDDAGPHDATVPMDSGPAADAGSDAGVTPPAGGGCGCVAARRDVARAPLALLLITLLVRVRQRHRAGRASS